MAHKWQMEQNSAPKCGIKMDIQNPANQNPVNQSMGSPNMGNQNMGNQIPNNNYQPNPAPVYYAADSGELQCDGINL